MQRLKRDFFERPTLDVAEDLIGKTLVFHDVRAVITETEAYIGEEDPACHAACGKTKRNAVMYEKAGLTYVYLIYGMYYCLNFVTERENFPAAVLIRSVMTNGVDDKKLNGPGKLCRFLGITKEHNGIDLITNNEFFVIDTGLSFRIQKTPRIGISAAKDRLWRFTV